jgi:thioredoxin-like negative regulator of GroEL
MIDIDKAGEIAEKEQIACVPTFIFYKYGKQVKRFSGADEALLITNIDLHK